MPKADWQLEGEPAESLHLNTKPIGIRLTASFAQSGWRQISDCA